MIMSCQVFNMVSTDLINLSGTSNSFVQNGVPQGHSYSQSGNLNMSSDFNVAWLLELIFLYRDI